MQCIIQNYICTLYTYAVYCSCFIMANENTSAEDGATTYRRPKKGYSHESRKPAPVYHNHYKAQFYFLNSVSPIMIRSWRQNHKRTNLKFYHQFIVFLGGDVKVNNPKWWQAEPIIIRARTTWQMKCWKYTPNIICFICLLQMPSLAFSP